MFTFTGAWPAKLVEPDLAQAGAAGTPTAATASE